MRYLTIACVLALAACSQGETMSNSGRPSVAALSGPTDCVPHAGGSLAITSDSGDAVAASPHGCGTY